MGYEIYQKQGEGWVRLSVDPVSIINDTLTSATTTWSSLEMKSRFEALAGNLKVEIVTERPATGVLNTMYYVGIETPYHIWLYANNTEGNPTWFDMGTTGITLTDYYTKTQADDRYLKLSGGTMTGRIITSEGYALAKKDNTGYLIITGGTSVRDGASLSFNGGGTSGNQGDFVLKASTSSSDTKTLRGKVDGSLTWNGSEVLTEATGLKLSGGSMTGIITTSADYGMKKSNTTGNLSFTSGTDMSNGGCLGLNGGTATYNPGDFTLRACISGGNTKVLRGKPNGALTWDGHNIMTDNNTYTKTEVDTSLATKQKTITTGTSEPSGGEDGDIYIKYEE